MAATDSDNLITQGEAQQEPPQESKKEANKESLGRQSSSSSIYSLTLDEFQTTLSDNNGKNFGSMNMDEFLNSIWTAEDNHETRQASSLSVPKPLCRKTVDQVWSEIHHTQNPGAAANSQRQITLGEMTLEDFLVKAGVVRAHNAAPPPAYPLSVGVNFAVNYQSAMGNGSGGFGQMQGLGIGSPASPVSSGGSLFGLDTGGGRKRVLDGAVEKVVERRQRRMIKNRESAARSRARKQAYTVELEAELNQLKEENAHLKQALADFERKRRQQLKEESRGEAQKKQSRAQRANDKLKAMRKSASCTNCCFISAHP